jgi:3-oxoacyl-[acyl-carrier protein] reductase
MKLQGKTAIVTGGGRDIGSAVAKKLASEGANVAINYFASSAGAEATVADIEAAGGKAFAMQGDLTKAADVKALVDRTIEAFGGIDVLVNNSGGLVARAKIAEMSLEHWQNVMDVNLTSTFMVTNAVLQHMTSGAIVNLASQAGRDGGGPGAIPYATSKGAMMTMTRGLAKELGPDIRVNALCPGMPISTIFIHRKPAAEALKPQLRSSARGTWMIRQNWFCSSPATTAPS